MSNEIFPSLPGIAAERDLTMEFDNIVARASSGRRYAMGKRLYPVYRWTLTYNFLRQRMGQTEMTQLAGFFLRRRGNLQSFLIRDREWNTVASPQDIGLGDGVTRTFRLLYDRGGFLDRVDHALLPVVTANGSMVSGVTHEGGSVTLPTAPTSGATLRWTGQYLFRVAFANPDLTLKQFLKDLYSTGVEIESVNR